MTHPRSRLDRRSMTLAILVVLLATLPGCRPQAEAPSSEDTLAVLDSALSELGGSPTANLSRGQRWRMISSIGAGLPPTNFEPADLPEPHSRGAGLLQAYCVQCHWLPTPQMHAAAEWPVLLRRMAIRSTTLRDRMGGPLTSSLIGDVLMSGFTSSEIPSAADSDTLLAYLQRNALPTARPGEIEDSPESRLFVDRCSICHETPSPRAHTAAGWERVVARMQTNMGLMDVQPLSGPDRDAIVGYLRAEALR
ncbi:MAG: hypothetical protein ACE5HF_10910 [Gemmatimonadota bacterium]